MIDGWVQVKKYWKVNLLVRVQQLVFEAKTLNFVEVERNFFWVDLVDGDACDGLVWLVIDLVEGKSGLTSIYDQLRRLGLELPRDLILSMSHELDAVLTEDVHVLLANSVVLVRGRHGEPKSLANHSVERHSEEIASKKE